MAATAERCSPRPRVPALLQPSLCHGKALWPELGVCLGLRQRRHTWPPTLLPEPCVLVAISPLTSLWGVTAQGDGQMGPRQCMPSFCF